MISINIQRAAFAATALISLSAVSSAQKTYSFPHVLETSGRIVAIGWDLSGGQVEYTWTVDATGPVVTRTISPIGALFSLYGNDEFFTMVAESLAGKENGNSYSIYSTQKIALGQNLATAPVVNEVRFPACDVSSKEPAGIEVYFNPKEYRLERVRAPGEFKAGAELAKRQKSWNPSNFRLKLGDLPCSRALRITAVSNAQGGTVSLPASRTAAGFTLSDVEITVPLEDAPAFREMLRSTIEGKPTMLPMRLDYLDDEGTVLMALEAVVYIVSVDKENPLDPFDPSDPANKEKGIIVKVKHELKGHVTLIR